MFHIQCNNVKCYGVIHYFQLSPEHQSTIDRVRLIPNHGRLYFVPCPLCGERADINFWTPDNFFKGLRTLISHPFLSLSVEEEQGPEFTAKDSIDNFRDMVGEMQNIEISTRHTFVWEYFRT